MKGSIGGKVIALMAVLGVVFCNNYNELYGIVHN